MKAYFFIIIWLQSIFLFSQPTTGTNGFQFDVSDTNINTKYSEIGTGFFKKKLIMVSSKKIGVFARKDRNTKEAFKELYCVDTLGNGALANPLLFSRILNTKNSEDQISFSPDEKTVYYTRSSRKKSLEYKLYKATLEEGSHGNWINEELIYFNSENVSIENPFVNANGDKLYFAANMPDAIGGYDIYVSDINSDGTLGTPKNLGRKINTTSDDKHPYVSKDNEHLFFASKGHEGFGGFDFFVSKIFNNKYHTPKNLGSTINTPHDEIAYFYANKKSGYFSSNRKEENSFDIFYFTIDHVKQTIEGKILDIDTKTILPNTVVILRDKNLKELDKLITGEDGAYSFDVSPSETYIITTEKIDYEDGTFDFASYKNDETTYHQDLELAPISLIAEVDDELQIVVENIYFEFDKHNIKEESYEDLDKIIEVLTNHPKIKLAIHAHTDNVGSDAYNLNLSHRRAKSTLNYLIKHGISEDRLISQGYGEREPLIDCKNRCTKEDRQTNRRVEFVIINASPQNTLNKVNQTGDYHVMAGSFSTEKNCTKLINQLKLEGFISARKVGKSKNGLFQVAYASYESKSEARKALETIRIISNEKAWLNYKKLN
ncbi:OmpA family protein [Flavivirga eckloniae]|uniref:OmpA-like domain-containing protein n=1 Tax=Flavivirga eckloniae TaxID=1803846 RepID=A0A2K9PP73_9FLAO|nr:OmpA family protein [Flavivirga eckloniae]AUP78844.1 hypothetical protein C1H87_09080 [Flavivirga eckloniae]